MRDVKIGRTKEITKKAIRYAKSVDIAIEESSKRSNPHHVSIILTDGDKIDYINPIRFAVGTDRFIRIYEIARSFGFAGKQTIKALVDSFNELDDQYKTELMACCWTSVQPADVIKMFYDHAIAQIDANRIDIGNEINRKSLFNLWWSLGHYRGLKAFFVDQWSEVLTELRRIRGLEEKAGTAPVIPIASAEFNPCMTCRKCKVDSYGMRVCKACNIAIPEDMTVGEVNKLYPKATIRNFGELSSSYIMFNPGECNFYKSRIGKEKTTVKSVIKESI